MMILSSFRDYYDSCASHGVDMTVKYHRQPRELNLRAETGPDGDVIKRINSDLQRLKDKLPPLTGRIPLVYVGFCGKIYAGLRPSVDQRSGRIFRKPVALGRPERSQVNRMVWDARDIHVEDLDAEHSAFSYFCRKGDKTIRQWLEIRGDGPITEAVDFFQRQRAVSFVAYDDIIIFDPCLEDYRFQRVVGGTDAFQQIEMFITGVLGSPPNPMIELTDQDRVQAHGFDQHSFRRAPTKRV